ncbi:MAG: HNH endonuclease [Methylobacillus glycogenes]|nr:HNH endonuclease [Methylobacillus glycogenes]
MASDRIFGEIQGVATGTPFDSYFAMNKAGVHRQSQAGISGSEKEGADSIVVSGGYEDDEDFGEVIIYTGQGGRNASGTHTHDQPLTRGNLALVISQLEGLPVRVIRGADRKNPHAPKTGYRYDGLFRVEDHWHETGRSGFKVWRYRLSRLIENLTTEPSLTSGLPLPAGQANPHRKTYQVQRVVRDTKCAKGIKALYEHACQVCGVRIGPNDKAYAEAAHIRALGAPHNGPDTSDNIICLCPNHHVMFDLGLFAINDDLSLLGVDGKLKTHVKHPVSVDHIRYHREHFYRNLDV